MRAWEDLYKAAPPAFRAKHTLLARYVAGALVITSSGLHLAHFNSAIGLGTQSPASEEDIDNLLQSFRIAGAAKFYIHSVAEVQAPLENLLMTKGLRIASSWDRVIRDGAPVSGLPATVPQVEQVDIATASEWAAFIDGIYHLPTAPWLKELVGRSGWHHYILRENGSIVAARSMFVDHDNQAWLGIDAPVPGIMTPNYNHDLAICTAMVQDGIQRGVQQFVADIEKPSPDRIGPAYEGFQNLGFKVTYLRHNFMPA